MPIFTDVFVSNFFVSLFLSLCSVLCNNRENRQDGPQSHIKWFLISYLFRYFVVWLQWWHHEMRNATEKNSYRACCVMCVGAWPWTALRLPGLCVAKTTTTNFHTHVRAFRDNSICSGVLSVNSTQNILF